MLTPGAAAFVAGVALIAAGSRFEPLARDQVAQRGDLGTPEGDKFIFDERRRGAAMMIGGGGLAVVGAVLLGVGGAFLHKGKRQNSTVHLRVIPSVTALTLVGVF